MRPQPKRARGVLRLATLGRSGVVFTLLLSTFLISTTIAQALESRAVLLAGYVSMALMGVIVAVRSLRERLEMPPEVGLYWAFAVWSIGSGLVVAADLPAFYQIAERVIYVGIVISVVAPYCAARRTVAPTYMAFIVLALVLVAYGFTSGNFEVAAEVGQRGTQVTGTRASSLTTNANALGMICFWAMVGLALYWGLSRRRVSWLVLGPVLALLLVGVALSASRKAFLLVFVFGLAWLWFCYRRFLLRNVRVLLGVLVVAAGAYFFGKLALGGTLLGYRLGLVTSAEAQDAGTNVRLYFYTEGMKILSLRPLTGVGLGQFSVYSDTGLYAHSEYVEILVNTGPVGACLYFGMYVVVWRRLRRVHRRVVDPRLRYVAGVCLASLASFAIVNLALVQHSSFGSMVLLAGILGFAYGADRQLLQHGIPFGRSARHFSVPGPMRPTRMPVSSD